MTAMTYTVATLRAAGLEAKWTKTRRGAPIIVARYPAADTEHQRTRWWFVDRAMWRAMGEHGIVQGFDNITLLGDLFSV